VNGGVASGGRRSCRRSSQALLPLRHPGRGDEYDLYPALELRGGSLATGWDAVAELADGGALLLVDGGAGVDWAAATAGLEAALHRRGRRASLRPTGEAFHGPEVIEERIAGSLGGEDPVFGRRFEGGLSDLLDVGRLRALAARATGADLVVVIGPGAGLAAERGPLSYLEVPRNEQQFRARAGALAHLGASRPATDAKAAYKRLYFVEWPLLSRHKAAVWQRIDRFVDVQRGECVSISGAALRESLGAMARAPFRARPWFEPGAWGGHWLQRHVPDLPRDVPNYAWSFELISPENGLLLEDGGLLFETGFDSLMIHAAERVLGEGAARFGREFPLRFDYLDTVGGGNLSVQVHPRPEYMREHFGEAFTQDEAYYIFDAVPGARVYLGLQEGVTEAAWRRVLTGSRDGGTPIDVPRWVRSFPARRGELFLIPSGTVHAAGAGSLVLEISATPYIFTFKLYDWLRLDLDGSPRPLHVERGLANTAFERRGALVERELISRPRRVAVGEGWSREHLPTHREHFYDVERLWVEGALELETLGSPQVLNVVGGRCVRVVSECGPPLVVRFAETFVVPAATGRFTVVNEGDEPATLVRAFLKPVAA
jgi:mannose-6-phosphate isomerase class I